MIRLFDYREPLGQRFTIMDGNSQSREADEVDDVGEDLDKPLSRWLVQVLEGEVVNSALRFRENPS